MKKGNKGENGGKPKIAKNLNMATKPGSDVESNKGPVISDPLRNTPVDPKLSVSNSSSNDGQGKVGMTGISQPLSSEPIRKKRVLDNDEIEVNYDSSEHSEGEDGTFEKGEIQGLPDFEKVVDNTSPNPQEVINDQDKEADKLADEIFGEEESSSDTIVSNPIVPIVNTQNDRE